MRAILAILAGAIVGFFGFAILGALGVALTHSVPGNLNPNDGGQLLDFFLNLPTAPGRLDVQVGDKKNVRGYAVGEAFFVPRNVPHALANVGTSSLRLLSIRFK